jgi:hypothetical protein
VVRSGRRPCRSRRPRSSRRRGPPTRSREQGEERRNSQAAGSSRRRRGRRRETGMAMRKDAAKSTSRAITTAFETAVSAAATASVATMNSQMSEMDAPTYQPRAARAVRISRAVGVADEAGTGDVPPGPVEIVSCRAHGLHCRARRLRRASCRAGTPTSCRRRTARARRAR